MRLLTAIVDLVRAWWQADRVRASPRDGRLLRIRPGAIVFVDGTMWEVNRHLSTEDAGGPTVRYECRGNDGTCELWIPVVPGATVTWIVQGERTELTHDQIEVWARPT